MNLLLSRMLACADPTQVEGLSRFFKTGPGQYGEGDKFLGIKVPVTREVVKGCWREMLPADGRKGFPELEECVCSEFHEVRLAALLTLVEIFKFAQKTEKKSKGATGKTELVSGKTDITKSRLGGATGRTDITKSRLGGATETRQCVEFYLAHTKYINNWDLVDLSCYPLLGEWLLDKDRTLLYDLARNGKTLWEQRIGMVSTMTFIRHGQLEDTFAIADILLHHPHDLIHKAVGWLLREAGKKDKNALENYLKGLPKPDSSENKKMSDKEGVGGKRTGCENTPRYQSMPRTMLRYAIEKFPEAERLAYLNGRAS